MHTRYEIVSYVVIFRAVQKHVFDSFILLKRALITYRGDRRSFMAKVNSVVGESAIESKAGAVSSMNRRVV